MSVVVDFAAARAAKQSEEVADWGLELVCGCGAEVFIVCLCPSGVRLLCPECGQDMTGALDVPHG